jgi:ABC-type spermidine/putrescine transport system permease subunit I
VDELDGGWNTTKTAMLATHLALSIAHVFAVFASRSEGAGGE